MARLIEHELDYFARLEREGRGVAQAQRREGPLPAPLALAPPAGWRTPFGTAPVDPQLNRRLLEACPGLQEDRIAHRDEHSLEMQMPFLQRLVPEARVSAPRAPGRSRSSVVAGPVATFSGAADALRQRLLIALALAFTLAAAMVWLGRRILARLLSRFERAVIALGQNRLERRIRLKGPEDMQRIGRRLDWLRRWPPPLPSMSATHQARAAARARTSPSSL